MIFETAFDEFRIGEICFVNLPGQGPEIESGDNLNARLFCTPATAAGAAE